MGKNLEILTSFFIEHLTKAVPRTQAEKAYTNLVDLIGKDEARQKLASISRMTGKSEKDSITKAVEIFSSELKS